MYLSKLGFAFRPLTAIIALLIFDASSVWAADSAVQAAREGDLAGLTQFLKKDRGAANLGGGDGSTPLVWAAFRGDAPMIKALIGADAEVNVKNNFGMSPLLLAARSGNSEAVSLLIKAGADIEAATRQGETALMAAAHSGALDAVRELLAKGSDPNAKDEQEQQTALMWAADEEHVEVVKTLLAAGADPNATARTSTLVDVGPEGMGVRADWARGGMTPLGFAARRGNSEIAHLLIAAGADLNAKNVVGITPLLLAVLNDRLDLAAELLAAGAVPKDGSLYETIRLHNLKVDARQGDESRPRPLNVNRMDPVQLTVLLLDKGADANTVPGHTLNTDGVGNPRPNSQSPYGLALQMQDTEILRLLLERKAVDANTLDGKNALTPLMATLANNPANAIFGGAGTSVMRYRVDRTPLSAAKLLIEYGADVNRQAGPQAETAVHRAALIDNADVIRLLAQHGAKLDVSGKAGMTPLDYAMGKQPPVTDPAAQQQGGPSKPKPQALAAIKELLGPAATARTQASNLASAGEVGASR